MELGLPVISHPFLAREYFDFAQVPLWIQPIEENELNTVIPPNNGGPDAV